MLRPYLTTAAVALLGASAIAQGDLKSRLMPITSPFRNAGTFHVATGTWTRNGALSNLSGPSIVYNNSCQSGYFSPMITGEKWQHMSRIPSSTGPTNVSANDPTGFDEKVGCDTGVLVNGFQIVYCSSRPLASGPFTQVYQFANNYQRPQCNLTDMGLAPNSPILATITATGLPPGTPGGTQICWIVGIDLDAGDFGGAPFTLLGDGNGTYDPVSPAGIEVETFGYSQGPTTAGMTTAQATGPVIAGNYTWTGGPVVGPLVTCTGTAGTIWDNPIDLTEEGTGMTSFDAFRITGTGQAPSGCYYFGGTIHADFYLKLFSNEVSCKSPGVIFCAPAVGECPCPNVNPPGGPNNDPVAPGLGCNNYGAGPAQSGLLGATGNASILDDGDGSPALFLNASGENNTSTNIFFTGATLLGSPVDIGAGRRCVGGTLKRLYGSPLAATAAAGAITRPGGNDPVAIVVKSMALNITISPGQTRLYFNVYRDPVASTTPYCNSAAASVNATNGVSVVWGP